MADERGNQDQIGGPLSYSSATLLANCEARYYHHKIAHTPYDKDYQDSDSLKFGKAFHETLEKIRHDPTTTPELLLKALTEKCKEQGVEEDQGIIHVMVLSYLDLHKVSGLQFIVAEIKPEGLNGYIDVIMEDQLGFWWIIDLKTKDRWDDKVAPKLGRDYQLNLYLSYREDIVKEVWKKTGRKLDVKKCGGCRYRVTTKSKAFWNSAKETYEKYVQRLSLSVGTTGNKTIETYDIRVPIATMNPDYFHSIHEAAQSKANNIANKQVEAMKLGETAEARMCKNYTYCMNYMKPCPWWSKCYGATFTECKGLYEVNTKTTLEQMEQDTNLF
jgi:hypothetical protein